MKKLIGIAAGVLFFLVILGLVLFKLLGSNTKQAVQTAPNPFGNISVTAVSTATDPAQFAHDFYAWYISNKIADPRFPSQAQLDGEFTAWLTPTFISGWNSRGNTLDADPVLYAQDSPSFWGGSVNSTIRQQDSSTALVSVSVGNAENLHTYTVHLVLLRAGWRIDSVEGTL
ncbi:MAG: hypothetical protein JWL75_511 [Parcubacteria group bacterium]|nr:hypothetical protein [Parcubacteria group bacterium]